MNMIQAINKRNRERKPARAPLPEYGNKINAATGKPYQDFDTNAKGAKMVATLPDLKQPMMDTRDTMAEEVKERIGNLGKYAHPPKTK